MNLQTTRVNTANALAKGKIALKDLEQKLESIAQKVSKSVKLAGFRPGKVPVNIVKSRYKDSIEQDAQREMVQEMLDNALKELAIDVKALIGDPIITKFEKGESDIDVEIKISIRPEFSVENIESKIPTPKIPTATKEAIDERIEAIAKNSAPLKESKRTKVQKDDVANIDFEGFVDGVAFEGGKASGFDLRIGSGQFIPGFEDALVGASLGEEKSIEVNFPENYHSSNLAGKKATFKVKINKIQEVDTPKIDDALAQKLLGNETATLKELRENIENELNNELKGKYYSEEMKEKCLEALHNAIEFDLPEVIVEQETDVLFRNAISQISQDELKTYQNDPESAKKKRDSFSEDAKRSVKVTFIVDAIARQRGIDITDNEVMSAIYYEAMMSGQNPKETLEYYKENNFIPAIKMSMIENRVLTMLLDEKAGIKPADKAGKAEKKAESKKVDAAGAKDSAKADSGKAPKASKTAAKDSSKAESKSSAKASK